MRINLLMLVLLLLGMTSCSQEEKLPVDAKTNATYKMTLTEFKPFVKDTIPLLKTETVAALKAEFPEAIAKFEEELDGVVAAHKEVDGVLFKLLIEDNKVWITDLKFVNTQKQFGIDIYTDTTYAIPPLMWETVADLLKGKCTEGWTSAGSVSSKEGVATATERILTKNLEGNGDCIEIQYARGLLAVQICYRNC